MFDVGFSELVLLAIVALVVLGPEKLPHAARMAGAWLGRIRRTVTSIQIEIEKEVAASELRDRMNQEIERLKAAANPVEEEFKAVENSIRDSLHGIDTDKPAAPASLAAEEPEAAPAAIPVAADSATGGDEAAVAEAAISSSDINDSALLSSPVNISKS